MIYEGRILNKRCIEKRFIAYKFVDILRELGYIKYVVLNKETTDLIYIKKGNDKLLFDKNDTSSLLNVYAYKECKEIPTEKAESAGLETFSDLQIYLAESWLYLKYYINIWKGIAMLYFM